MKPEDRNPPSLGYDALPNAEQRRAYVAFRRSLDPPCARYSDDPIDWRKSTALGLAILIVTAAALAAFAFIFYETGRRAEREAIKAAAVERVPR